MTQMSKEYATALFQLAAENHTESQILEALKTVSGVLKENPDYVDFLSSPGISKNERLDSVKAAFEGRIPEYVLSFVQLLCERSRVRAFDDCLNEYEQLYNASMQISEAYVTSAVELTDDEKKKLKLKLEKMSGKSLILKCTVDKSVLGGVIVKMDGKIMDGSLKHRLEEVKEVIGE